MGPGLVIVTASGIVILGRLSKGESPHPRIFLGAVIAGAGMLTLAQFSPEVAAKLAGVVLMTAIMTSGYDVAQGVTRALNR